MNKKVIKKLNKLQEEAVDAFIKSKKKNSIVMFTGLGKSFVFFKALYRLKEEGFLNFDSKVIFISESSTREEDMRKNAIKYADITGNNPVEDFGITFHCYKGTAEWKNQKFDFVCADEFHDSLTPVYSKFYKNNEYKMLMGLSATPNTHIEYKNEETGEVETSKKQLMEKYMPTCFSFTMEDAIKEGLIRDINVFIINNKLNKEDKNVEIKAKGTSFKVTESESYNYWTETYEFALLINSYKTRVNKRKRAALQRAKLMYNLKSKEDIVRKLINVFEKRGKKTLIFGNSIAALKRITPHIISGYSSETENQKLREKFKDSEVLTIGASKKLKQGANLEGGLDNLILHSYYASSGDFIQRMGRLRIADSSANVFIIVTKDTVEELWASEMLKDKSLNIHYCDNVDEAISKYKSLNT